MILSYVYKQEETDIAGPEASQELYKKNCSEKFQRIHRMPVPLFGGAVSPQYLTHNLKKKESSTGVSLQFYETFRMFLRNIYERLLRQAHMATSKKSQFYCLNII